MGRPLHLSATPHSQRTLLADKLSLFVFLNYYGHLRTVVRIDTQIFVIFDLTRLFSGCFFLPGDFDARSLIERCQHVYATSESEGILPSPRNCDGQCSLPPALHFYHSDADYIFTAGDCLTICWQPHSALMIMT